MLAWLFTKIGDLRNSLYERGVFKSTSLEAPTFSIGNITVGGTGKTPLVAYVTSLLAEKGEKVCILTRGYGRESARDRVVVSDGEKIIEEARVTGDEPLELARKLKKKAVIIADGNRVAAGLWAKKEFGITAFVLDDAFQHRRVERDLDIVCIDATDPFGLLREPAKNLARAGAVLITRANLSNDLAGLRSKVASYAPDAKIFAVSSRVSKLACATEHDHTDIAEIKSKNALAFCALGNPGNFFRQLQNEGFELASSREFRDHHFYTQEDVSGLEKQARECGAEVLLTTAKDAVKLTGLNFELPFYIVESEIVFNDETAFRNMIYSFLP